MEPNARRYAQFVHGDGGNKIMNCVEAAAQAAIPNNPYRMRYVIVLEICARTLAAAGERALSRLSSSYTTCGGTNAQFAGISTASAISSGEKPYLAACDSYSGIIRGHAEHEAKIVAGNVQQLERIKGTLRSYERLVSIFQLHQQQKQQIDKALKGIKKITEELSLTRFLHHRKTILYGIHERRRHWGLNRRICSVKTTS